MSTRMRMNMGMSAQRLLTINKCLFATFQQYKVALTQIYSGCVLEEKFVRKRERHIRMQNQEGTINAFFPLKIN